MLANIIKTSLGGKKTDGISNQDYIMIKDTMNWFVVSISDGLGSSKYGLEGAKVACKAVKDQLEKAKDLENLSILGDSIISNWSEIIREKTGILEDYRAANSFVAIHKSKLKIIIGVLGDVFVSVRVNGDLQFQTQCDKDFLNETECLGSGNSLRYKMTMLECGEIFDFLIASDGIGDELEIDKISELHDYFISKYNKIQKNRRNMAIKNEITRFVNKNADDKSLVFVWR